MRIDRAPTKPADDLAEALEALFRAAIGLTSFALADAAAADLTLPQWRALVVIGRAPGLRVGDIAARLGTSLPSTSRLVRRLARRGYVTLERDDVDRRATVVALTPTGEAIRDTVIERRHLLMKGALAAVVPRLPRDLLGGLTALARAFDRYE